MREPKTALDDRFSDQNAVATSWNDVRRAIEDAQLFWIATVRSDDRPHLTPLVAVWLDNALHFTTGPQEHKAVNLRTNQNVLLLTGCNDWDHGLDVVVEGTAIQVRDNDTLEALAEA